MGVRADEQTNGRADEQTNGRADKRTSRQTDEQTSRLIVRDTCLSFVVCRFVVSSVRRFVAILYVVPLPITTK